MSVNRLISDSRQGFRNDQKVPGFESVIIKKLNLFIIILLQQSNSIIVEVSHEEPSPGRPGGVAIYTNILEIKL